MTRKIRTLFFNIGSAQIRVSADALSQWIDGDVSAMPGLYVVMRTGTCFFWLRFALAVYAQFSRFI